VICFVIPFGHPDPEALAEARRAVILAGRCYRDACRLDAGNPENALRFRIAAARLAEAEREYRELLSAGPASRASLPGPSAA
jgi:hypothetical protein